jgi:hypothetical protein
MEIRQNQLNNRWPNGSESNRDYPVWSLSDFCQDQMGDNLTKKYLNLLKHGIPIATVKIQCKQEKVIAKINEVSCISVDCE